MSELAREYFRHCVTLWKNNSLWMKIPLIVTGLFCTRSLFVIAIRKWYGIPVIGPFGLPILGSLHRLGDRNFIKNLMHLGPVCTIAFGLRNLVIINDPRIAKSIYNSQNGTDIWWSLTDNNDYHGLALLNGKSWHSRRKYMLDQFISLLQTGRLTKSIWQHLHQIVFPIIDKQINVNPTNPIYIEELLRCTTFNVAFYSIFGQNIKSIDDPIWIQFDKMIQDYFKQFIMIAVPQKALFLGSQWLSSLFASKNLSQLEEEIVIGSCKLTQNLRNEIKSKGEYDTNTFYGRAMSNMNKSNSTHTTEMQLMTDIKAILLGATDTSASQQLIVIFQLAKYHQYQEQIYNELINVFGKSANIDNISFSTEILVQLPTVRAFVGEVCRLYHVASESQYRVATKKIDIEIDGKVQYTLSTGTLYAYSCVSSHFQPQYWQKSWNNVDEKTDMEQINLNNWINKENKFVGNESLSQWSIGRRQCPGKNLAIREMIIITSLLVYDYHLKLAPDIPSEMVMYPETIQKMHEIPLIWTKRQK